MEIKELALPGLKLITPKVFHDHRGYFLETHRARPSYDGTVPPGPGELGERFVQGNLSSSMPWTMRGLHYQLHQPQGKLVRCIMGRIWDVAVDIRLGSPTYGKYVGVFLDDVKHEALYVPPGFAHGFLALGQAVRVQYECTTFYHDEWARAVNWRDPMLNIGWPISRGFEPIISNKDRAAPLLRDLANAELPIFEGDPKVMGERIVPRYEGNVAGTDTSVPRYDAPVLGDSLCRGFGPFDGQKNDAIEQGEEHVAQKGTD